MSNIQIIENIIEDSCLFHDQQFIIENDNNAKGKPFEMKFEIIGKNIVYKLYRFEDKYFPFFKEKPDLKKMCDFILFAEENKHLHIFLIELKLGPDSAKKQLLAAEEFALFLLKSSKRIDNEVKDFSIKKIRICQKFVNKRPKMAMQNNYEFDKDNYLEYKLNALHLNYLMQY